VASSSAVAGALARELRCFYTYKVKGILVKILIGMISSVPGTSFEVMARDLI
jgi:hypothetical protein